jgi:hypothetical protein
VIHLCVWRIFKELQGCFFLTLCSEVLVVWLALQQQICIFNKQTNTKASEVHNAVESTYPISGQVYAPAVSLADKHTLRAVIPIQFTRVLERTPWFVPKTERVRLAQWADKKPLATVQHVPASHASGTPAGAFQSVVRFASNSITFCMTRFYER